METKENLSVEGLCKTKLMRNLNGLTWDPKTRYTRLLHKQPKHSLL